MIQAPSVMISLHPYTLVQPRSQIPLLLIVPEEEWEWTLGTRLHTRLVFKKKKLSRLYDTNKMYALFNSLLIVDSVHPK